MSTVISWTNETWNPTTGCHKVSEGCRNCYAERLSTKFGWTSEPWTQRNASVNVRERPERLGKLKEFKPGARVFVNSMSDLFHERVSDAFIRRVFDAMNTRPDLTFQVLTKRPERAAAWTYGWSPHIWMGTSVEDARVLHRVDALRGCQAHVRFLSMEPLIGPVGSLDLSGIDWVIVGGESGPGHRPMPHEWVWPIRDACLGQGTAFFFKQSAAYRTELGVALEHEDGRYYVWQQYPGHLSDPVPVPGQISGRQLAAAGAMPVKKKIADMIPLPLL